MAGSITNELYKAHRPTKLTQVVGQDHITEALRGLHKAGKLPHFMLLTGPSGCGKTTIARIVKRMVRCSDHDYREYNSANMDRGIDAVRQITSQVHFAAVGGDARLFMVDEMHQMTIPGQEAFLKLLEDTPRHLYIIGCTTNPTKLIKAIHTRATNFTVRACTEKELVRVMDNALKAAGITVDAAVVERAAKFADGSPRAALVVLNKVLTLPTVAKQLDAIARADPDTEGIDLCRVLLNGKPTWTKLAPVLAKLEGDPERIRWSVLGYAHSALMRNKKQPNMQAWLVIQAFRDNFYDCGKFGLDDACMQVVAGSK